MCSGAEETHRRRLLSVGQGSVCHGGKWVWIGERIEVRMAWEASLLGQTPSSSIHRRLFVAWGLIHTDQTDKAGLYTRHQWAHLLWQVSSRGYNKCLPSWRDPTWESELQGHLQVAGEPGSQTAPCGWWRGHPRLLWGTLVSDRYSSPQRCSIS